MLTPADRVVVQEEGGELFLLHLGTGKYFSLNRTGLLVWRALEAGDDPLTAVAARYPAVPEAQLTADVAAVLDQLRGAGLVVEAA